MRYFYSFLLTVIIASKASAQVYPVNGNAALIPPYSVYLADYTSRATERLMVNVVLNDVTRPELRVRLRIKIEGQNIKLETKPEYIGPEIILQGGVPLRLSGTDLIEYFSPNNLNFSGITRREFEKTGALPQGFYQFCFEVLEYNRGVKISNSICAPAWLILNDPPIVNLPRNNEKLKPTLPQNVIFQWTPRHTGSPNSAFATEYEIKMVEVWPATRNPNDAILTSPPILEASTRSTTFIYGPAETPLELGRRYAFRIKAKSIVGVEEFDLFKNNGYSEVVTFVYGDACEMPQYVSAQAVNPSRFKVQWTGQFNHTGYTVRYRQAGDPNAEWYTSNTFINETEISSLKANTKYEYQVAGGCGVFESEFTPVATVATKPFPVGDYSCGLPLTAFNLDPSSLIASLKVGDIIQVGDFDVQLTKVTGSNGAFNGEGVVVVPFLNNVKVKAVFESIMVNKENRMVGGYMNITGAAIDIVPDEVTAMMDELSQSLDKIEAGLDKAENVLNEIESAIDIVNKVLEEVKAYLPDDIIKQIEDAKKEIAAAKDAMQNASTPEAKEAAETQLKAARTKLKDSAGKALEYYAQAIQDFIKILKESLQELVSDAKNKEKATTENLEESEKKLDKVVEENNSSVFSSASQDATSESFFELVSGLDASEDKPSETNTEVSTAIKDYYNAEKAYNTFRTLMALANTYSNEDQLKKLGEELKKDGESILKTIAIRLKERVEVSKIKEEVKSSIRGKIDEIVSDVIYNSSK